MKRTINILKVNIINLMNQNDLTYPQIDRMQIRNESSITGRFLRQIATGEREPGLKKLDAITDLFGIDTAALLTAPSGISKKAQIQLELDDSLRELIRNYNLATEEGRKAIESTANIAPKRKNRRNGNS